MLGTRGPGLHRGNQEAARWRRDQPGHSRQRERTKVCCGHGGLKLPNCGGEGGRRGKLHRDRTVPRNFLFKNLGPKAPKKAWASVLKGNGGRLDWGPLDKKPRLGPLDSLTLQLREAFWPLQTNVTCHSQGAPSWQGRGFERAEW